MVLAAFIISLFAWTAFILLRTEDNRDHSHDQDEEDEL